jgi:hypothetical protein
MKLYKTWFAVVVKWPKSELKNGAPLFPQMERNYPKLTEAEIESLANNLKNLGFELLEDE